MTTTERIKKFIEKNGPFTTADVEADCAPCVSSFGNIVHQAEGFYPDHVEVNAYLPSSYSSDPIDTYNMPYSELEQDLLEEILKYAIQYDQEASKQPEQVFLGGADIITCPTCGSRTDFEQAGEDFQFHTCLNHSCKREFVVEFE